MPHTQNLKIKKKLKKKNSKSQNAIGLILCVLERSKSSQTQKFEILEISDNYIFKQKLTGLTQT
jgi:tRNA-binding EMAP/Myf-like protein